MSAFTIILNKLLAAGTIAGGAALLGIIAAAFIPKSKRGAIFISLSRFAIPLAFLLALAATLGSLYYSEIAKFAPCPLCWYQRIVMYPEVILLGFMLLRRNTDGRAAALTLAAIGAALSGYHSLLQAGLAPTIRCSATEQAISCSQRYVYEMGFVTIPVMTFVAFALIFACLLIARSRTTAA